MVEHPVQAAVAAGGVLTQLSVAVQDHRKAVITGSITAEVEVAGHHMDVISMLVCICVKDILVPKRECLLGIVEAYDLISVFAEVCGPDAIQTQQ